MDNYVNMGVTSLPEPPTGSLGGLLAVHDNLDAPVGWDKSVFGIPIVAYAMFRIELFHNVSELKGY